MQAAMDIFANPAKSRILLEIMQREKATAKQLRAAFPDIAQATLYRYLNKMVAAGVLDVVAETQKRGASERVYAVSNAYVESGQKMLEENPNEGYLALFNQYIASVSAPFYDHIKNDELDMKTELSGFFLRPVCASPEELQQAIMAVSEILQPLTDNNPAPGRNRQSIGIIITPPQRGENN